MTRLKKEWGVGGAAVKPGPRGSLIPVTEKSLEPASGDLTIAAAIKLYNQLEEEVDALDWLLDPEGKAPLTDSIRLLLDERRCESARKLQRIREVFEVMVVAI